MPETERDLGQPIGRSPVSGKYRRHFSPQSLSQALEPLIGVESQPSVQFSPVFLCNLNPVLTSECRGAYKHAQECVKGQAPAELSRAG